MVKFWQFSNINLKSSYRSRSKKKAVLKNFSILIGKHRFSSRQLYYKETPTHVLSCKYCEVFKNIYFKEHLRTAASWELFMRVLSKEKLSKFIKETVGYFLMFLFQNAFDPLWNKSWIYTNFLTFCTNLKKLIIFIDWVH